MIVPITFTVIGTPAPGGSKRAFIPRRRDGTLVTRANGYPLVNVSDAAGQGNKIWRRTVAIEARKIFARPLAPIALSVQFTFYVKRPLSHYRGQDALRGLHPKAPKYPKGKPDALKLGRSTEDALTGIAWNDDAMNVDLVCRKRYADAGWTGCEITITPLEDPPESAMCEILFGAKI